MITLDLIDVWRELHRPTRQYTWRKFNSTKQGRLDYFLISNTLVPYVDTTNIFPGYRSDHSIISIKFNKNSYSKGRSYWKFNNSLLKDTAYSKTVKNVISDVKKQYSALVYHTDSIDEIENKELCLTINDQLFLEVLLMEIRGKTIAYSSYKKREIRKLEKTLNDEIAEIEQNIDDSNVHTLDNKKRELENIRRAKVDGMIVRSKAKYIEEGEKNTKYFSNLEKKHNTEKCMSILELDDGSIITDPDKIKQENKNFYENLYSSKEHEITKVDLDDIIPNGPKLSEEDRNKIEGELTEGEVLKALKHMQNDKSPGSSGYTSEFYKFFWRDIGSFVVRSLNYGFRSGQLSVTQRQGIITCIPKEGKDKRFLQNWRPITLLNTSYKLASACISFRIKSVLPQIIHGDQTGFLAGRYIGENIRMLYDILFHTETHNIPGQLLLVDFHKAFDSLSWSFIEQCLNFFNFGPLIKQWIKTFYNDIKSCVAVNGSYTEWFKLYRGCRQGDPCSPYIFLICAEILSLLIRNNKNIKGIKITEEFTALLSQFADDTSLFLDGSKKSFSETIKTLEFFASLSGLNINFDKTVVVWIGSKKNSDTRYLPNYDLKWNPRSFKALGVIFSTNINEIVKLNFDGKLESIRRILMQWSRRHLTPYGKITIIKTQALSKIVYLLINIPDPPVEFITSLDKLFFEFLWDNKPPRINRDIMCAPYSSGGFGMIDLYDFIGSMKISWLKRNFKHKNTPNYLFLNLFPKGKLLHIMGDDVTNIILNRNKNPFWNDVFKHYRKLHVICIPRNEIEFNAESIHNNTRFKRGNKSIFIQQWLEGDITNVKHILKEDNGNFLNYNER